MNCKVINVLQYLADTYIQVNYILKKLGEISKTYYWQLFLGDKIEFLKYCFFWLFHI